VAIERPPCDSELHLSVGGTPGGFSGPALPARPAYAAQGHEQHMGPGRSSPGAGAIDDGIIHTLPFSSVLSSGRGMTINVGVQETAPSGSRFVRYACALNNEAYRSHCDRYDREWGYSPVTPKVVTRTGWHSSPSSSRPARLAQSQHRPCCTKM
jgi:hypothetical protein